MSRIGKHPVKMPDGVSATIENGHITIKGKLGELTTHILRGVTAEIKEGEIVITPSNDSKESRTNWGTLRANVNNLVKGVSEGFKITLELIGVGYRAVVQGQTLKLTLGFSHDIDYALPAGVRANVAQPTIVELTSADKQLLGQVAAEIRSYRSPEPYKGKGVKYSDETVLRKEGKKK